MAEDLSEQLPRCDNLDGSSLRIVPAYTEAGRFCEANCVTITDGERTAVYVPMRISTRHHLPLDVQKLHAAIDRQHEIDAGAS